MVKRVNVTFLLQLMIVHITRRTALFIVCELGSATATVCVASDDRYSLCSCVAVFIQRDVYCSGHGRCLPMADLAEEGNSLPLATGS